MERLRRLLLVGLLAGLAAGAAATLLQAFTVVPLILQAEALEPGHRVAAHAHPGAARNASTLLFNALAGIGFGLLLAAAYNLRGRAGPRAGLLWGVAGFAAFYLAPALGLPPSLPGTELPALAARQAWWLGTAAATAAGLALAVFGRRPWVRAGGLLLLALPHLVGAPQPGPAASAPPRELAQRFVLWSAAGALLFWTVLGTTSGWLFGRFIRAPAA